MKAERRTRSRSFPVPFNFSDANKECIITIIRSLIKNVTEPKLSFCGYKTGNIKILLYPLIAHVTYLSMSTHLSIEMNMQPEFRVIVWMRIWFFLPPPLLCFYFSFVQMLKLRSILLFSPFNLLLEKNWISSKSKSIEPSIHPCWFKQKNTHTNFENNKFNMIALVSVCTQYTTEPYVVHLALQPFASFELHKHTNWIDIYFCSFVFGPGPIFSIASALLDAVQCSKTKQTLYTPIYLCYYYITYKMP